MSRVGAWRVKYVPHSYFLFYISFPISFSPLEDKKEIILLWEIGFNSFVRWIVSWSVKVLRLGRLFAPILSLVVERLLVVVRVLLC